MTDEKRNFDAMADIWDEDPGRVKLARAVAASMMCELPLSTSLSAMDVGCGTGLVTLALAPHLGHVVGADSSEGMLAVLAAKVAQGGVTNVEPRRLDPVVDELPEGALDLIFSSMALHHVAEPAPFVGRLARALAPGGTLAIADLDAEDGHFHHDATGVFHHGFSEGRRRELFEGAGLGGVRTVPVHTISRPGPDGAPAEYRVLLTVGSRPR